MSAMTGYLEPVEIDYTWIETASPRMRETGRTVHMPVAAKRRRRTTGLPGVADGLRTVAAMVWFSWLIVAGVVAGATALVVVAKLAWSVLGWAVAL